MGEKHYFQLIVSRFPGTEVKRAFIASLTSFTPYLLLSFPVLNQALGSTPFWLQVNFSFTIFLGFFYGQKAFREFSVVISNLNLAVNFPLKDARAFNRKTKLLLAKPIAHLFSLPFIFAAMYVVVQSGPNLEMGLTGNYGSPAFIYMVFVEAPFMLDLLGGTGYWLIFSLFFVLRRIKNQDTKLALVDIERLKAVGESIRKLSVMLFFIILSLLPCVIFVAYQLESNLKEFLIYMGVFLPVFTLFLAFLIPSLTLNRFVQDVKNAKLHKLRASIFAIEVEIFSNIAKKKRAAKISELTKDLNFLRSEVAYLEQQAGFVFSPLAVSEIVATAFVSPLTTVLLQKFIGA